VAEAPGNVRSAFIRKTYMHLAFAILAFAALEWVLLVPLQHLTYPLAQRMVESGEAWLVVLGLFMLVGYIADRWARSAASRGKQYMGLGIYILAEAVIFMPLMYMAVYFTEEPSILPTAAILTLGLFAGLTAVVFVTRKDFSFMRSTLMVAGFVALGLIVASILIGFELGLLFAGAMIILAGGYILYYTSNVLHHYHPDQYVAASLALFAAVALMFWYILLLLLKLYRR
jgi:FtsH-binding integral membrane protein